ncbi:TlpA family protein disulfide reductase [Gordonia desulfuricans]|uniref:TlpA family protein disulfide reductase n=1 Tax=Gordonia desulfuricans TaxID=89051 RepID=A0A7K3LN48_9ACTN|nr:TlpA disulfide reductase family protein [Gordonia desulfuricans]NDK89613.1 TlpA family protein disulfide reductase [Gordonia desulfuricans]
MDDTTNPDRESPDRGAPERDATERDGTEASAPGASGSENPGTEASGSQNPGTGTPSATGRAHTSRFPPAARWTLVFFIVIIALVVAIWPRGGDAPTSPSDMQVRPSGALSATDLQVDDSELAQARADAALAPCPQTGMPVASGAVLAGVVAPCLASGVPYDLGVGTAGRPVVINMWAVWCQPCRRELPVLAEYARRAGDAVTVLTVHAREGANNPYLVLRFLAELGVHLPTVLDQDGKVAAALQAPRVFPSTIILRADGTVAKVAPQVFEDPQQIADVVRDATGVTT